MLTQLSRFGKIAQLSIQAMRIRQVTRFFMRGSALQGTLRGGPIGLDTHIEFDSDEPPEKIRHLVKMGEQTCFTLQSLINPVPIRTSVTLNGEPVAING